MKNFTLVIISLLSFSIYSQTDGTLDSSFGTNGKVITDLSSSTTEYAFDGIQLSDSKILVGGYTTLKGQDNLILKYLPNGALDTSFGTNGYSIVEFGNNLSQVRKIGIQNNGKIILAGRSGSSIAHATISRLNTDGTLDTTFGTNGITTKVVGSESDIQGLHILPDNKIIVVGYALNNNADILVIKLNADGSYDNSFGTNGVQIVDFESLSQRAFCSVMNGDKILIGGVVSNPTESSLLVQLNSDGSIDKSFGLNGYTATQFGANLQDNYDRFTTIKISNNKIYGVGSRATSAFKYVINLAKFSIDGQLDTTFSDDGKILIDTKSEKDFINDINILNDNSILLAGVTSSSTTSNSLLIKLNPDGTYKTNFGVKGIVTTNMNSSNSTIQKVIVNGDNFITIGATNTSGSPNIGLAKYKNSNSLGIIDNQFKSRNFNVFPNPVKDKINITSLSGQKPEFVTLINTKGQILFQNKLNTEQINVENLPNGIYILKIYSEGIKENIKIIKY